MGRGIVTMVNVAASYCRDPLLLVRTVHQSHVEGPFYLPAQNKPWYRHPQVPQPKEEPFELVGASLHVEGAPDLGSWGAPPVSRAVKPSVP